MSLTGALLACSAKPAQRLGIIAGPAIAERADELARTIGRAWAERTIPAQALEPLATGIAVLVMTEDLELDDDVPTALEVHAAGVDRFERGVLDAAGVRQRLTRVIGYDATDEAFDALMATGRELWTALGDRRIPAEALSPLVTALSLVADASSPARDLHPGGLQ